MPCLVMDNDDRVVRRCPPVASVPLVGTDFLSSEGLSVLLHHLVHEGRLTESSLVEMIEKVTELMTHEPNIVRLNDPVTIVGDLHGQFYDLVHIFTIAGGSLPERAFLFLGDYVDRGSFSVEILTYLFAIKLVYPDRVVVVRGNHESKDMNIFFNFKNECLYKYTQTVYDKFVSSFYAMPLGAIVNDQYLCMHGGISPSLHTLSQLFVIDRFTEPPLEGLFCDILWSDPDHVPEGTLPFRPNNARGCSYFFSNEAACRFLQDNGLKCIIRAHEVQLEGYKMGPIRPETNLPAVITVFSAPNYCDQYGNKGAILNIINNSIDIVQFDATMHPFTLPGFMNVFDWSIPFVAEKITELLHAIVHVDPQEEVLLSPKSRETVLGDHQASELVHRLQGQMDATHASHRLRAKVQSVTRLLQLMQTVRKKRETQVSIHISPSAPQTPEAPSTQLQFNRAAEADFIVEKRRPS